jgi:hypothetical protein
MTADNYQPEYVEELLQPIIVEHDLQRNARILEKLEKILQIVKERKNEKVNKPI